MSQLLEKAWVRSVLTVFSVLLVIGGPTFLIYLLREFGAPYPLFWLTGLATFIIGILLFVGLAKGEKSAQVLLVMFFVFCLF